MADSPRAWLRRWRPQGIFWPLSTLYNGVSQTSAFRRHYELVAEEVAGRVRGGRILDIGTGPGWLLAALRQRLPAATLVGVDIAPAMMATAKRNLAGAAAVELHLAGAGALPFPDASFDLVVSTLSLHHWKDLVSSLNETCRVLKDGQYALIYDLVRHMPPEVCADVRRQFGGFRLALLWLHSFHEPFLDPEELRDLAARTHFGKGETHFAGAMCCLVLRKLSTTSG
jgi:ubiquinone/menaquinone biosynthesis C-methylase UbiE